MLLQNKLDKLEILSLWREKGSQRKVLTYMLENGQAGKLDDLKLEKKNMRLAGRQLSYNKENPNTEAETQA